MSFEFWAFVCFVVAVAIPALIICVDRRKY